MYCANCQCWQHAPSGEWIRDGSQRAVNLMPGMGSQPASLYGALSHPLYNLLFLTVLAGLVAGVLFMFIASWWPTKSRDSKWSLWSGWGDGGLNVPGSVASFLRISFGIIWTFDGMFQLRPDLPGGFVSQVAQPSLQGAPSIVTQLINPLLNLWNTHPIRADVVSGWLQILIGITMIFLNSGRVLQLVLWLSVGWSAVIFVFGNGFGIFYNGASFVTGAPAAILIYGFVSIYLLGLARGAGWTKSPKTLPISVATFLFLGGFLQALPQEGYWGKSLAAMFGGMASANQPGVFSTVIQWASDLARAEPVFTNALFVTLVFASAVCLVIFKKRWAVWLAILVTLLGWWFGQDFGIFSATATDFNSGLPLILVLTAILRGYQTDELANSQSGTQPLEAYKTTLAASSLVVACLFGTLLSAVLFFASLFGADSAAIATVDSSGYKYLSPTNAPAFTLTNFDHRIVSLSSIEGSPILLTFLNPLCPGECQTLTREMLIAAKQLGILGSKVKFVVVDVNPSATSVVDTSSYARRFGINRYKNWYVLSGQPGQLKKVWSNYSIQVAKSTDGTLRYTQVFYYIDSLGVERGILQDTADASYSGSYSTLIAQNLKQLL